MLITTLLFLSPMVVDAGHIRAFGFKHLLQLPERDVLVFLFVELFVVPLGENLKRGVELLHDHLLCWPVRKQLIGLLGLSVWLLLPLRSDDVLHLPCGEVAFRFGFCDNKSKCLPMPF